MSQIQRYFHKTLAPNDNGNVVLYSDYEALQRENERLKAPVTREELENHFGVKTAHELVVTANNVNAFIASRATQPAPQEGK